MAAIDIRKAVKTFTDRQRQEVLAVDSIDLAIRDNDFLCLLGPPGCGKSTLLTGSWRACPSRACISAASPSPRSP